jgi:hypothetical protein
MPGGKFKPGYDPRRAAGGRPKIAEEFKLTCRRIVDEHVIEAWRNEVVSLGEHWVKCSELLAAYGYGRPVQHVEVRPEEMPDAELKKAVLEIAEQWKQEGTVMQ